MRKQAMQRRVEGEDEPNLVWKRKKRKKKRRKKRMMKRVKMMMTSEK